VFGFEEREDLRVGACGSGNEESLLLFALGLPGFEGGGVGGGDPIRASSYEMEMR